MSLIPSPWIYDGDGVMRAPTPYFVRRAEQDYTKGQRYFLVEHRERSSATHNHYFAALDDAFNNLPEKLLGRFPTVEHLRKTALIDCGFYDERSIVCSTAAEARRLAAFIAPIDTCAVISVAGPALVVRTAKSQSYRAMSRADFRKSKEAVLAWVWDLVGVDPETGNREAGRAA